MGHFLWVKSTKGHIKIENINKKMYAGTKKRNQTFNISTIPCYLIILIKKNHVTSNYILDVEYNNNSNSKFYSTHKVGYIYFHDNFCKVPLDAFCLKFES